MVSSAQTRRSPPGQRFLIGKKSDNYPLHFFGYPECGEVPLRRCAEKGSKDRFLDRIGGHLVSQMMKHSYVLATGQCREDEEEQEEEEGRGGGEGGGEEEEFCLISGELAVIVLV